MTTDGRPSSPVVDQAREVIAQARELDEARDSDDGADDAEAGGAGARRATTVPPAPRPAPVVRRDPAPREPAAPPRRDTASGEPSAQPAGETAPVAAAAPAARPAARPATEDPSSLQQLTANLHAECADALAEHERRTREQGLRPSRGAIILEAVAAHHADLAALGPAAHRRDDLFPGEQTRFQRTTGPDRRSVSFYVRRSSREVLDRLADETFGGNRSALVEAALRRHLGLPDLPTG